MPVSTKIQVRRDTATNWASAQTAAGATPVLAAGEIGYITSGTGAGSFKIGDGTTLWGSLKLQSDASLLSGTASITALTTSGSVTVGGNLTVNGTTTSINSSTLQVDDKNIELGSVAAITGVSASGEAGTPNITVPSTTGLIVGMTITRTAGTLTLVGGSFISSIDGPTSLTMQNNAGGSGPGSLTLDFGGPSDTTADGAGITVKGTTDKTLTWVDSTDAWTSNQDFNIAASKVYEINAVTVLSNTQVLGYSITNANTISTIVNRDGSGNFSAGTITASLTGTASLATNLVGGTANKGEIVYQSGVNTTAELTAPTTNNQVLAYNTSTNAPYWSAVTGSGSVVLATSPTFVTPLLGTPTSGNLVSTTGYTVDNLANTGTNVITFLKTPTSANFLTTVTGATGNGGGVVFANNATLVAPTLGVATATSLNKVTVTAPTTAATLTLADNSTLATVGAFSVTLTGTATTNVTLPTTGTLATQTFVGSATVAQANNLTGAANVIFYNSAANTTAQLAYSTANNSQVLTISSGVPTWVTPAAGGVTNVTAGTGLTGGSITTTGTIAVNTSVVATYGNTGTFTATQTFQNASNASAGLIVKNHATQQANVFEIQYGGNTTPMVSVSNTGTLFAVTIDGGTA